MPRMKSRKCSYCKKPGHQNRTCPAFKATVTGRAEPPANGHSKSIEYLKYRADTLGDQLRAINLAIAELDAAGE